MKRLWADNRLELQFLLVSAVVLGLVGVMLYKIVSATLTGQAIRAVAVQAKEDNATFNSALLSITRAAPLSPAEKQAVDQALAAQVAVRFAVVKVWSPDGVVLYSSEDSQTGQKFDISQNTELLSALQGESQAELTDLSKPENTIDVKLGFQNLLEVYTPLVDNGGKVVGAFEVYRDGALLVNQLRQLRMTMGGSMLVALLLVWGVLNGFVRRSSLALKRQHDSLVAAERARESTLRGALAALAEAVEAKDSYTGGHTERVSEYAVATARALGVPAADLPTVEYAALLHDVGKMVIPDSILGKPGKLTPDERLVMDTHSARGQRILSQVPALEQVAQVVRNHHERWDGAGYPDKIAGDQIPMGARIIAVVDTYDAMTTHRPYRRALPHEVALAELQRYRGTQFDPAVVDAFLGLPMHLLHPEGQAAE